MQTATSAKIWQGEHYNRTYSALQNSFSDKKSCIVVTGGQGVGKTTIVNQFVKELGEDCHSLIISGEQESELDFYSSIASGFGVGTSFSSKVQFLVEFGNFLYKCNDQNKKVVLIIDDCHRVPQQLLEIIRQISNIEKDSKRLLHLLLVGDSSFDKIINSRKNKPLRLSLALHHKVEPFELKDTAEYVNFRLESVGCKEKVFCLKGIEIVHKACRGRVRKINLLCEHVLAKTEANGGIAVELSSIYESVEQLGFAETDPKPIPIEKPDHRFEEKQVLYQTPEEVLPEQEEQAAFEEVVAEPKKKSTIWIWILFLLGGVGAVGWWFIASGGQGFALNHKVSPDEKVEEAKIVVPIVQPSKPVELPKPKPPLETPELAEEVTKAPVVEIVENVSEKEVTQPSEENTGKTVTELPELPMFPENTTTEPEEQKVVLEEVTESVQEPQGTMDEIVEPELEQIKVVEEVVTAIEPVVETEIAAESVVLPEALESPPAKPEPTVLPLESKVDEPSPEEILAENLIEDDAKKDAIDPVVVVELSDISKRKPESPNLQTQPESPTDDDKEQLEVSEDYPKEVFIFRLEPDSSELTTYYKEKFKAFVKLAQEYPDLPIQVRGYVSSDNDTDENRELSRKRAIQVYKMLLDNGVEFTRVQVIGMGVEDPIMSNATPQGRYKNRRVEVEFVINDKS